MKQKYNVLFYMNEYRIERVYNPKFKVVNDVTYMVVTLAANNSELEILYSDVLSLQETE